MKTTLKVSAKNAFDSKEDLKDNGFVWDKENKVWTKEFASQEEYNGFQNHFMNVSYYGRHAVNKFHSKVVFEVEEIVEEEEMEEEPTEEVTIEDVAYENGLDLIQTTSESNGYPSNIKPAIIGFETFEEAQKLADKYDLSIEHFQKRDGWSLWYRNGNTAYEAYEMSDDTFGPNAMVYYKQDIDNFKENEIDAFLEYYEDEDDREYFIAEKMKILEHLKSMNDDEVVLTDDGLFVDVIKLHTMSYYEDVYTYTIGLIER